MENKKFNIIISKDENGNLIKKFAPFDENHQVECFQYGDYVMVDEDQIQEAKEELLVGILNTIKEVAKNDRFWIVKPVDGGKCTVGWKIDFPQMYSK
jgi:hypothetical protein